MKKRIPKKQQLPSNNSHKANEAKTGEHCPITGWWMPTGGEENGRFVTEGSIMPAEKGQSFTWTLITNESGAIEPKHAYPR